MSGGWLINERDELNEGNCRFSILLINLAKGLWLLLLFFLVTKWSVWSWVGWKGATAFSFILLSCYLPALRKLEKSCRTALGLNKKEKELKEKSRKE